MYTYIHQLFSKQLVKTFPYCSLAGSFLTEGTTVRSHKPLWPFAVILDEDHVFLLLHSPFIISSIRKGKLFTTRWIVIWPLTMKIEILVVQALVSHLHPHHDKIKNLKLQLTISKNCLGLSNWKKESCINISE